MMGMSQVTKQLLHFDVGSTLGSLYHADVGTAVNDLEVYAASIFRTDHDVPPKHVQYCTHPCSVKTE
jgi:hypothetical protein